MNAHLRSVGVGARVRHGHDARTRVLQVPSDLVLKLPPEARLAPPARPRGVASLDHEILDHPMENGVVVVPCAGRTQKASQPEARNQGRKRPSAISARGETSSQRWRQHSRMEDGMDGGLSEGQGGMAPKGAPTGLWSGENETVAAERGSTL